VSPVVRSAALVLLAATAVATACTGPYDGHLGPATGTRLISGKLLPPSPKELAIQTVGLQLAAVQIDARQDAPILSVTTGPLFDPAADGSGKPAAFRISVPEDESVVLILQTPVGSGVGLGRLVARMLFAVDHQGDRTDLLNGRLPSNRAQLADIDLGTAEITSTPVAAQGSQSSTQAEALSPYAGKVVVLGDGASVDPLSINDCDGDGVPDLDDSDWNKNGVPNDADPDANGDGIPDADQTYSALLGSRFDADGDGVPDVFQP
jgi:hypothetical protein